MSSLGLLFFATCFLVAAFIVTALNSAFRRLPKRDLKKQLAHVGGFFFYRNFIRSCFPSQEFEVLYVTTSCAQNIYRFFFAGCTTLFLVMAGFIFSDTQTVADLLNKKILIGVVTIVLSVLISFFLADFIPRIVGSRYPEHIIRLFSFIGAFLLTILTPLSFPFFIFSKVFSRSIAIDTLHEPSSRVKAEIMEIIQEADVESVTFDPHDKKILSSVMTFRERIAKEVMVPRVDLFSLSAETSIKDATKQLQTEGYSRIPVYRNNIDNIIGVLMYKDVISKYLQYEQSGDHSVLEAPIETLIKNVLYTPENKRISLLLQEFRKKQVHLAIVVDEYGGTEGIVTIEDILEEIVGEIADEYDEEEESLFIAQPDGSWIVDARMSIFDIEEELGIKIPQDSDYETLGGYIFQSAGAIPSRGFTIHHDDFDIEVLSSSDRSVEKVKIRRNIPPQEKEENDDTL